MPAHMFSVLYSASLPVAKFVSHVSILDRKQYVRLFDPIHRWMYNYSITLPIVLQRRYFDRSSKCRQQTPLQSTVGLPSQRPFLRSRRDS